MNLETEKSMHRSELSTTLKRSAELEELLIDAEADDEQVQQTHPVLRRPVRYRQTGRFHRTNCAG